MTSYRSLTAALLLSTSFAATAAHAQSTESQELTTNEAGASDPDILVTAQKIEQRAVDVPITISVNSGARLRELGVSDLDELSNFVPGLNIQEQSANNPGIVIRGITSDSGSAQQAPRVTLYYNGVDISRSRGSYQAIYDVDRIEVIKGPQATLFGTASAVGAISIVSARPKPGFSGQLTGGYGNFDAYLVSGFVNAGNDTIALRLAGEYKNRDGYVTNLSARQPNRLYSQDQLGLRASLRYTPVDALTVDLIGTYDRQRNGGTPFISGTLPTEAGRANPFGAANLSGSPVSAAVLGAPNLGLTRDVYDANLTVAYDFAPGWTFTTVNGYRRFDSLEIFDADGSRAFFLEFAENAFGYQFNHESRFAYKDDHFRAAFGGNFFREDSQQVVPFSSNEATYFTCAVAATRPNCVLPNGTVPAEAGPLTLYQSVFGNIGKNDTYSLFGDVTWLAIPRLELTAGARVLIEQRRSGFFATVPRSRLNPALASLIPGQVDTAGQTFFVQDSFSAVLPRFNALYRVSDNINVFATISKGRRSPTVQLGARATATGPVAALTPVAEENVWNYEGGIKGKIGPVSGSLGVYYQNYTDFQVSVVQPNGTTLTQSAGNANNFGVEAEANWRVAPWLNIFGNIGYINGGISRDSAFSPAFAGARFRLQPEIQTAAGFTIDAPLGGGIRVFATPTMTYRSQIFFELPNNPLISQAGVTLYNARAGVSFDNNRFEIAGFVRNASNERYLLDAGNTGGAFGIPTFIPGEPRFYGFQVSAKF
ncbi:MAG: TonB-dependent receptor [Sphingomonas sp.]|uniref:TonB-dependent receptor n=1 Tax=Sphingomonas sp. TaxID=28214 RepID=UPI0035A85FB8|nr:TonB-dependent receptor [Sphingomonas sp.]